MFDLLQTPVVEGVIPYSSTSGIVDLMIRFFLNMFVVGGIIQFFYYAKSKRRDYYFTFILFSITVFLLIYLLDSVKLQIGMALGLFAIFGILRYRTETVPIREMTYLFIIIGISVINGLTSKDEWAILLVTNIIFMVSIWIMESNHFLKHVSCKLIVYDKIALIKPEKNAEMLEDLRERTGLNILKAEVGHIDFLKDTAFVKVYYMPLSSEMNTVDGIRKVGEFTE